MTKSKEWILLNSIGPSREDQMFTVKSALLNREEKNLVRRALFLYQKDCYNRYGDLTDEQHELIAEIADKLHLR